MTPTTLTTTFTILVVFLAVLTFQFTNTKQPQHMKHPYSTTSTSTTKMSEVPISLPTSDAPGLLFSNPNSTLGVILTHPWGPLGGNLHNNVVRAGTKYFQQSVGASTLRFDFVGWQVLSGGYSQQAQVVEAAQYLVEHTPATHILLVGYSYGSLLAASASATIDECVGVVSIAPPWAVQMWLLFFHSGKHLKQAQEKESLPRLMIIGDQDNFTSVTKFEATLKQFPQETTTGVVLPNRDHFFHGKEAEVMKTIGDWLIKTFPNCEGDLKKLGTSAEVYN